jgi:ABC-type dipeptide/oligopeptide/nickel transport system permease subunit
MVPNVLAPFLIMLTAFVGQAILAEASLSYLGLGVQEPTAAWSLMLRGGAEEYTSTAPWIAVFPGLAIALTVFGFSLFGDVAPIFCDVSRHTFIAFRLKTPARRAASSNAAATDSARS